MADEDLHLVLLQRLLELENRDSYKKTPPPCEGWGFDYPITTYRNGWQAEEF
jgi:hypothetical protein